MDLSLFTVEEENLICIFDTDNRSSLITDIKLTLSDFEDPELQEITENIIRKLNSMTDDEFNNLTFSPVYHGDEDGEII
jgi:hypothetical protein